MKKKYFITGGTGSFGQKFAEKLIEKKLAKKKLLFSVEMSLNNLN